jgi:hypothetical protein
MPKYRDRLLAAAYRFIRDTDNALAYLAVVDQILAEIQPSARHAPRRAS